MGCPRLRGYKSGIKSIFLVHIVQSTRTRAWLAMVESLEMKNDGWFWDLLAPYRHLHLFFSWFRDVKKSATGGRGKILPLRVMGTGILNIRILNGRGGDDHCPYTHSRGYPI